MMQFFSDVYSVLWISLRDLRRRWRAIVATSLVQPLLYLVAFGYGMGRGVSFEGVDYLAFVIPGIIALTAFSVSFNGAASKLQVDRFFFKSFDELLMSPVSLYAIVLGKALVGVIRGLISSTAILLVGIALCRTLVVTPLFVLVLVTACCAFALFGVLVAFVVDTHHGMSNFSSMVILPMTFLCGTFFSLSDLPEIAKTALYLLPLTHASQSLRAAALDQTFPWLSLAALIIFGIIFYTASIIVLKKKSV